MIPLLGHPEASDSKAIDLRLNCKKALRPLFHNADSLQWNHGGRWAVVAVGDDEWLALPRIDGLPSSLKPGCLLDGSGSLIKLVFI